MIGRTSAPFGRKSDEYHAQTTPKTAVRRLMIPVCALAIVVTVKARIR